MLADHYVLNLSRRNAYKEKNKVCQDLIGMTYLVPDVFGVGLLILMLLCT